eukprot:scaffold53368_cov31-Phaeocystis_antarctica.AAC.1
MAGRRTWSCILARRGAISPIDTRLQPQMRALSLHYPSQMRALIAASPGVIDHGRVGQRELLRAKVRYLVITPPMAAWVSASYCVP